MLKRKIIAMLFVLPMTLCQASSLAMISGSISDSLTGISDSISNSSKSSSNAVKTAEGNYKITDVADAAGKPDQKRMTLQSLNPAAPPLYLYIAKNEFTRANLAAGQVITAHARPYGVAFTALDAANTFAVVLDDASIKDLNPNPVEI